jgi:PadR family transcriptional regulator PadR
MLRLRLCDVAARTPATGTGSRPGQCNISLPPFNGSREALSNALKVPFPLLTDKAGRIFMLVTEGSEMSKPTDLVQGTLDLLLLRVIALAPMHGWAIAQRIRQMSNEELRVGQGSLYPALHKLEQNGWVDARWGESENNRRAKYYSLTKSGRKALERETAEWERLSAAISLVVKPT